MPDVVCLGEMLIDFVSTQSGVPLSHAPGFLKAAGGAPANVAVGLSRLGVSSGFIGKVGDDEFGRFLAETLASNGVDVSGLQFTRAAKTTLAFVSIKENGERDFMFYRDPGADELLAADEIDGSYVRSARIFHFGSIGLIAESSREATWAALKTATLGDVLISYDPNLRPPLWPSLAEARERILEGLGWAQVVKVSEEELEFLSGVSGLDRGAGILTKGREELLLVVTLGERGCYYRAGGCSGRVSGFKVATVDTTGAGDAFVAGLLAQILWAAPGPGGTWKMSPRDLEHYLTYANAAGALTTTKRGAIPALPTRGEVEAFLRGQVPS